jgi:hypothetical protein
MLRFEGMFIAASCEYVPQAGKSRKQFMSRCKKEQKSDEKFLTPKPE